MKLAIFLALSVSAIPFAQAESHVGKVDQTSLGDSSPNGHEFHLSTCNFRIKNLYGGWFSVSQVGDTTGEYVLPQSKENPSADSLGLSCFDSTNQNTIDEMTDAKLVDGKWIWSGTGEPFRKNQNLKIINLKGSNWTATGVTYDDTTGDEETRQRHFSFCLIHGAQALCGNPFVANLNRPKENRLEMIKEILQTIAFVDSTSAPAPAPASAPASSTIRIPEPKPAGTLSKTLCITGEEDIFNCIYGKKKISICEGPNRSYAQYRFGATTPEIAIPPKDHYDASLISGTSSLGNHAGDATVSFKNGEFIYSIEYYEEDRPPSVEKATVTIIRNGSKVSQFECHPTRPYLFTISGFLSDSGIRKEFQQQPE